MSLTIALRRPTPEPELSLEERAASAEALAAYALDTFSGAASALEDAARQQELVASLAQEELDRALDTRELATARADEAFRVAGRIRALIA